MDTGNLSASNYFSVMDSNIFFLISTQFITPVCDRGFEPIITSLTMQ